MQESHDPPRPGDAFRVMSDLITFRVTDAGSGGRLTVVEIEVPPNGGPPPLHTHPPDELFQVIAGEVTVFIGGFGDDQRRVLAPGDHVHVPGGTAHTFRNLTDRPARLTATFVPGLMMERFFVAAGLAVRPGVPITGIDPAAEVERVLAVGEQLGMRVLSGPAPG